ncbi:MAG: hypothetical protein IPG64_19650 [Haliea sp.]|nr:hypothetical protein [Haliea sp.]
MLTDDGLVGVVQHRAPATASAEWADGSRGYLNQAAVIASFEEAGFGAGGRERDQRQPAGSTGR